MGMNDKQQISRRKKIAFVCSGGATKAAAFHMGVSLALHEKGFRFLGGLKGKSPSTMSARGPLDVDTYVGSSAGSVIAAYLAAGYSVDQIFNAYLGRAKQSPLKPLAYSTLMTVKASQHEEALREPSFTLYDHERHRLTVPPAEATLPFRLIHHHGD